MRVCLMGNVAAYDGGRPVTLSRAGERGVLATLALSPGRRIQVSTLIDHVWGEEPPANADYTIASYARAVRRTIEQAGGQRDWLSSHRPGAYRLDIPPDLVDYHRFAAFVAAARDEERAGRPVRAVAAYQQAVQLRHGEPLANVTGQWAENCRYALEQEYLDALCALYEQQLAIGQFAAVAASARHLITEVPPTDRMIVLAAQGLAGSGQHAAINEFVERATRRMWETADAQPSAEALTVVRELVARPGALFTLAPVVPRPDEPAARRSDVVDGRFAEPGDNVPEQVPNVLMTATHNGRVNQTAGDQFIIEL